MCSKNYLKSLVFCALGSLSSFNFVYAIDTGRFQDIELYLPSSAMVTGSALCAAGTAGGCAISATGAVVSSVGVVLLSKAWNRKEQILLLKQDSRKLLAKGSKTPFITYTFNEIRLQAKKEGKDLKLFKDEAIAAAIILL